MHHVVCKRHSTRRWNCVHTTVLLATMMILAAGGGVGCGLFGGRDPSVGGTPPGQGPGSRGANRGAASATTRGPGNATDGSTADPAALAEAMRQGDNQRRFREWRKALRHYWAALRLAPNVPRVQQRFDEAFAKNFKLPLAEAKAVRKRGQLRGRLASLPSKQRIDFAIDELLLKHHRYVPKSDRPGVPYLDMRYLLVHVFVPAIIASHKELLHIACAKTLRKDGKRANPTAVQRAMGKTPCTSHQLDLQVGKVLRDPVMRFALIRRLAPRATHPKVILARAAREMIPLIGASLVPVCWSGGIRPAGDSNCSTKLDKPRRYAKPNKHPLLRYRVLGYAVKHRVAEANMIRSALELGIRLYGQARIGGAELKRLRARHRRARRYRCFQHIGEIYRERLARGWSKVHLRVGHTHASKKEIPCRTFGRVGYLMRLGRSLRSATVRLAGAKYTGRWRTSYRKVRVRGKVVKQPASKTREIMVYYHRNY